MSDESEEYCRVHRHKIYQARKEHVCCACRAPILPGHFYASVFVVGPDGDSEHYKRCGSCEVTWQHLNKKCEESNRKHGTCLFAYENLGCGKAYEEEWGELPDELADLPFLGAAERGQLLAPKAPKEAA